MNEDLLVALSIGLALLILWNLWLSFVVLLQGRRLRGLEALAAAARAARRPAGPEAASRPPPRSASAAGERRPPADRPGPAPGPPPAPPPAGSVATPGGASSGPAPSTPRPAPPEGPVVAAAPTGRGRPDPDDVPAGLSAEQLAIRLAGALGSILVVAAALFGLETAIDAGWLGPGTRVLLAALAGGGLWGASLFVRRWQAYLGGALGGAGVATLLGALFAATTLYGFVGPTAGAALAVLLVGAATADGVRAESRLQVHVATLGALATPVVLPSEDPHLAGLYGLVAVAATFAGVAGAVRRWWDVALLAGTGAGALTLYAAVEPVGVDPATWLLAGPLLVAAPFAAAAAYDPQEDPTTALLALVSLGLPVLGLAGVEDAGSWLTLAWLLLTVGSASLLARRAEAPWILAVAWPVGGLLGVGLAIAGDAVGTPPIAPTALGILALAVLPAALAPRSAPWALDPWPLTAAIPAAWLCAEAEAPLVAYAVSIALGATGLIGLAAGSGARVALAGTAAAIGLSGAVLEVDDLARPGLWVAAAATASALAAWPGAVLRPTDDRWSWARLGAGGPALVIAWPLVLGLEPILGSSAAGLGPLALAAQTGAVAWRGHTLGDPPAGLRQAVLVGAGLLTAWIGVEVLLEDAVALAGLSALIAGAAVLSRRGSPSGAAFALSAGLVVVLRLLPGVFLRADDTLEPWLGSVWPAAAWGVPAALLGLAAAIHTPEDRRLAWVQPILAGQAILLGWFGLNVLLPSVLVGDTVDPWADPSFLVGAARSVTWGGYGLALLGGGLALGSRGLRGAGFALVLLGAAKVFAVDLWSLSGLARVGSALGLGVTLLAAAFGFQRVIGREAARDTPAPSGDDA